MKRNMPVGIDDFKKLIEEDYYFVDKTRFIKELIDGHSQVTLITRPRRFGKTLAMSMLKYFFTLENAEENRSLFDGLDITHAGERYMKEQGTRPVVFISLKDVKEKTFSAMIDSLRESLRQLYGQFRYLRDEGSLTDDEQSLFSGILQKTENLPEMQSSISNLSGFLSRYHRQTALLLIDEYDAPIQAAWEFGYYDDAILFFRNFLGAALKTNPALDFAILTGVLRISKESIFSALNNLKVSSVIHGDFADIMGFTQDEVSKMAKNLGHADKIPEIREWYDGYSFSDIEIYNPWSVINYFDEGCEPRPHWVNTSGNAILKDLLSHIDKQRSDELSGLMNGKSVITAVNEGIIYSDIYKDRDALYTMLATTGYLKCIDLKMIYDELRGKLTIPNKEVRSAFRREILLYMAGSPGIGTLYIMMDAMREGDVKTFEMLLAKILRENVGIHDTAYPENFYHGMMLGFSVLLDSLYEVDSNEEGGYGRFDLALFPKEPKNAGIVMEFKRTESEDSLDEKAQEALSQIEEKEYITALTKRGVTEIWKYGIAFCGKKVKMLRG